MTIPDNFSREKVKALEAYGATVILADSKEGNDCHIKEAVRIREKHPEYKCLNQFENDSNFRAHYETTGPEILKSMGGDVACFVSSIGSGGTISGVGSYLKEEIQNVNIVGVQPKGCEILKGVYVPHKIQATAVGRVGSFFRPDVIDSMISVDYEKVLEIQDYLVKAQGIFVGLSGAANILAAFEVSQNFRSNEKIVTVAPDSGRSYLDK